MTGQLPLTKGKHHATLVSVYAPTMMNPDDAKERFCHDLKSMIAAVSTTDKLIIPGDFNARVGTDNTSREGILGTNGVGSCSSNGLMLLETCTAHELLITNSIFQLANHNRTSWIYPDSKHWHLLYMRQWDRHDITVKKTRPCVMQTLGLTTD